MFKAKRPTNVLPEIIPPSVNRITVQMAGLLYLQAIESVERHGEVIDPWSREDFERTINEPHVRYVVGRYGLAVVGYACGYFDKSSKTFEVAKVVVLPDYRRQGIGRAMVNLLCRSVHFGRPSTWPREIRATLWERRVPGLLFLKACGFRRPVLIRDGFDPGEDMVRQFWSPGYGGFTP